MITILNISVSFILRDARQVGKTWLVENCVKIDFEKKKTFMLTLRVTWSCKNRELSGMVNIQILGGFLCFAFNCLTDGLLQHPHNIWFRDETDEPLAGKAL